MKLTVTLISCTLATFSFGQVEHTAILDGNNVQAIIGDEGVFFNNGTSSTAGYEVPAGSGKSTIYNASIWAGGFDVNGQLHLSNNSYPNDIDWHSGPVADPMFYGTANYTNTYGESIWKVTRQEVEDHIQQYQQMGYVVPGAILDWPGNGDITMGVAQQLAPFVDLNGDGVYDPQNGDYPDFPGDQVVYTIVNDVSYNADPNALGAELHLMFYQYNDGGYLGETTFLNARVFNRSTTDYYDFRQTVYIDFDIGNFDDDMIGCDSTRNIFYAFNGDPFDETIGGNIGYGANAPCQAIVCLNHEMSASVLYTNGTGTGTDAEFWNNMLGLYNDGSPIVNPNDSTVTTYAFHGNPFQETGWFENFDSIQNPPADQRGAMTIAPGDFPAGSVICADYAFIYDDTDGHLENVQNVFYISDALQTLYENTDNFGCKAFTLSTNELSSQSLAFDVQPNPSHGTFTVSIPEEIGTAVLEVRDVAGRIVYREHVTSQTTQITLNNAAGMYMVRVITHEGQGQQRLVLH